MYEAIGFYSNNEYLNIRSICFFCLIKAHWSSLAFIFSVHKLRIKKASIKNSKRENVKQDTETMFLQQFNATESEAMLWERERVTASGFKPRAPSLSSSERSVEFTLY